MVSVKWRSGNFLIISLCIHIIMFIFLSMVLLNGSPEPRESVNVQLVKLNQQLKKLRRDTPELRIQRSGLAHTAKKPQNAFLRPLIKAGDIPLEVVTEVIPLIQYEPAEMEESAMHPKMDPVKRPLASPKVAAPKPAVRSAMENRHGAEIFEIHEHFPRLSSSHGPVSPAVSRASDSTVLRDFLRNVSSRIEKSKRYPEWARDAGLEGKVVVRFTILEDGTLGDDLQLVSSSGTEILDNAAMVAVTAAAPFPALPRSLGREWIRIEVPMDFRLKES